MVSYVTVGERTQCCLSSLLVHFEAMMAASIFIVVVAAMICINFKLHLNILNMGFSLGFSIIVML